MIHDPPRVTSLGCCCMGSWGPRKHHCGQQRRCVGRDRGQAGERPPPALLQALGRLVAAWRGVIFIDTRAVWAGQAEWGAQRSRPIIHRARGPRRSGLRRPQAVRDHGQCRGARRVRSHPRGKMRRRGEASEASEAGDHRPHRKRRERGVRIPASLEFLATRPFSSASFSGGANQLCGQEVKQDRGASSACCYLP